MSKAWVVAGLTALIGAVGTVYLIGLVPGTDPFAVRRAKTFAARALVDPSSAQFRDVTLSVDRRKNITNRWICGAINGKNRMGAYAGFIPFYVSEDGLSGDMLQGDRPDEAAVQDAIADCARSISEGRYSRYSCERKSDLVMKRNEYDGRLGVFRQACGNGLGLK